VRENRKDRDNKPRKECFFFLGRERDSEEPNKPLFLSLSLKTFSRKQKKA
jgi:hypothetical protein